MTEPCRALRGLLEAVVREYRRILGRNLAGIYLHGSAVALCVNRLCANAAKT